MQFPRIHHFDVRAVAVFRHGGNRWGLPIVMLAGLCLAGCSQGRVYTVKNLPAEWKARPTSNIRTVGLTKLAIDPKPVDEVAPGDVIEVSIAAGLSKDESVTFAVRVDDSGFALLPHIDPINLSGLTLQQCESAIKIAYIQKSVYRDPHVAVTMKQRKVVQFTIVGAVENEGTYNLAAGSAGLLNAISVAGGFAKDAGTIVEIRYPERSKTSSQGLVAQAGGAPVDAPHSFTGHGTHAQAGHRVPVQTAGPRTVKFDLASLGTGDAGVLQITDGAVIMVERRDPLPLQVRGLVNKPDIYDFPVGKDVRLLDAIAMAGGESSLVADKVIVIRRRPEEAEPAVVKVSLSDAKLNGSDANMLLEPGDTVSVEQTPQTVMLETLRMIGFNATGRVF